MSGKTFRQVYTLYVSVLTSRPNHQYNFHSGCKTGGLFFLPTNFCPESFVCMSRHCKKTVDHLGRESQQYLPLSLPQHDKKNLTNLPAFRIRFQENFQ